MSFSNVIYGCFSLSLMSSMLAPFADPAGALCQGRPHGRAEAVPAAQTPCQDHSRPQHPRLHALKGSQVRGI